MGLTRHTAATAGRADTYVTSAKPERRTLVSSLDATNKPVVGTAMEYPA